MSSSTAHSGSIPHGGQLIDRAVSGEGAEALRARAEDMPAIELDSRHVSDLEMIASGAYSPLTGFMTRRDYGPVLEDMRLESGLPWTIPITLPVPGESVETVRAADEIALMVNGSPVAILHVEDVFDRDLAAEAQHVYRTRDEAHPGVATLLAESPTAMGGAVQLFARLPTPAFPEYRLPPKETRRYFQEHEWRTVVGFQTRNPVHRAHEYLQKCALEIVDGLLLHPLVGDTKSDDIPADLRMHSYEVLLRDYYPRDRVLLAVNPAAMRYGGPREAIFHALIRKNYGCTHFIVGRDHAGVGNYYGPYDAQHIFNEFPPGLLDIQPLFFENSFFCRRCENMATDKTCPHPPSERVTLSGTQVRAMLSRGELPPPEFSRPEVASVLAEGLAAREASSSG